MINFLVDFFLPSFVWFSNSTSLKKKVEGFCFVLFCFAWDSPRFFFSLPSFFYRVSRRDSNRVLKPGDLWRPKKKVKPTQWNKRRSFLSSPFNGISFAKEKWTPPAPPQKKKEITECEWKKKTNTWNLVSINRHLERRMEWQKIRPTAASSTKRTDGESVSLNFKVVWLALRNPLAVHPLAKVEL